MEAKSVFAVLLVGRIVTLIFMTFIIRIQIRTLRSKLYPNLNILRKILLGFAVIFTLGNIPAVIVDVIGLTSGNFGQVLPLLYAFTYNGTFMILAVLGWAFYKIIEDMEDDESK